LGAPAPIRPQALGREDHRVAVAGIGGRAGRPGEAFGVSVPDLPPLPTAHRAALSCGCEYFRAMFCSGMREARQGAAPLPTLMAPADLRLLLPFAYSGTVAGSWAELLGAAETALQYQASGLLALCLEALQRALSPARSLDLLAFARAYDLRPLGTAAQAYALANFHGVARCPGFPALPLAELLALLGSDQLYVASEVEAFEAALRWLDADRTRRLPHAEAVLARVRFHLMGTRELRRVRAAELLAPPGRLYQLLVVAVAAEGPCRVRTPGRQWGPYGEFPPSPHCRYDPVQDSWQRLADMPSARSSFPAVGVAGQIYALGGSSEDAYCTDEVQCYDPPSDAWR
uniref:BTB domain-containing protein n=1 Tax=Chelydra serpentina TaxID=8475 RepID=A0A8C3SLA8_CHESE